MADPIRALGGYTGLMAAEDDPMPAAEITKTPQQLDDRGGQDRYTQRQGESVEDWRGRMRRLHKWFDYKFEGNETTGPTDRDLEFLNENMGDSSLGGFEQWFGVTPNANWRNRKDMEDDLGKDIPWPEYNKRKEQDKIHREKAWPEGYEGF